MADIAIDVQSTPVTPASGVQVLYADTTSGALSTKDAAGFVRSSVTNFSSASQSPAAATRTYLTGSALRIGTNKLQVGSVLRWRWNMTKTAAGSAASTIDVCVGTAGTTADTARLSFTKPAGTAAIDEAFCELEVIVRGPVGASGVFVGEFTLIHNLASTGHATIPCVCVNTVSAAFDITTANLIVGVCLTSGASDAITIQQMFAEAYNI